MGVAYNTSIVTNGLGFCVDAANIKSYPGTGTAYTDLSESHTVGTLYGSPVYSNGSLSFNGSQYGLSPTSPISGSSAWSVTGWFKRTNSYSAGATWGFGTAGSATNFNSYNLGNLNEISIDLYGTATYTSGQIYDLNTWTYGAWVFAGATLSRANMTIWKNSNSYTGAALTILRGGEASTPNINAAGSVVLGRVSSTDATYYAPVTISHLAIYNRALTSDEVRTNFNAMRGRYGI